MTKIAPVKANGKETVTLNYSLWMNLTKRKVIGGIGRPFLTAFAVNVFLLEF